jgi:hypothetical protein
MLWNMPLPDNESDTLDSITSRDRIPTLNTKIESDYQRDIANNVFNQIDNPEQL